MDLLLVVMTMSDSNPRNAAMETFDRLQRRTVIPIALAVAAVAIFVNGASIWLLPLLAVLALAYLLMIIGGARLIRASIARLRDSDRE